MTETEAYNYLNVSGLTRLNKGRAIFKIFSSKLSQHLLCKYLNLKVIKIDLIDK